MRVTTSLSNVVIPLSVAFGVAVYGFVGVLWLRRTRGRAGTWRNLLDPADLNVTLVALILIYAIVQAIRGTGLHLPGEISTEAHNLLLFAVLCGLASYGTIEIVRRLFRVRGWLQLWETKRWLEAQPLTSSQGGSEEPALFVTALDAYLRREGRAQLRQVFDLPTDQLAAQLGAAVDITIEEVLRRKPGQDQPILSLSPELGRDLRAEVDRLQIALQDSWRRGVQGAAVWLAGAYGVGLSRAGAVTALRSPHQAIYSGEPRFVLVALLLGGPIAWLARDLAALVARGAR